ncbi:MAG TPA: bifunctional diguanylate cyclase/phosphodiesterase [Actinoplanes sp.]
MIGGGLFILSVGWFLVGLERVWTHPVLGWVPTPLMSVLAAYTCFDVARRTDLAAPIRRFWRQLGFAAVLLGVAVVSNAVDALTGPNAPSQYLSTRTIALDVSVLAVAMWALLRLPSWQRTRADWSRFGLDAAIILLTLGSLAWHFSFRQIGLWGTLTGSTAPVLAIIAVTVLSMVAFVKLAIAGAGELDRRSLQIMSGGVALSAARGSMTPLLAVRPYLSTSFLACAVAALTVQLAAERQGRAPMAAAARPPARRRFSLPYLATAAMSLMLISAAVPRGGEDLIIAICVVTLTGLVGFRQVAAMRENNRLLGTVDSNLQQLRDYQDQLAHQVSHDALTEIGNRAMFNAQLTAHLAADVPFHVALLDIDDFKVVNDRLGHGMGDALLKAISRRLHERLAPGDTVARLGGDEFTLLLPGRTSAQASELLLELVEEVQVPLMLNGHDMVTRVSIGVTTAQVGDDAEEMLRRADVAMYAAKSAGGGRLTWFDPIMDQLADADARLGADLRQAVARDELFILYQPIVELPHGRLAGVEALVRWRHPEHGLVAPSVFIPLAERNGSIVELGRWILHQVVRQAADWEQTYGARAPEKVSVNISARQLREPGFPEEVAELLRTSGVDPFRLVAEVTETAVLGTGEALEAVRALHDLGLRVALDDFGTGQSSLSLLVDTPVRVLKVDKSFVDGVTMPSSEAVIVDGLIGITDGLRIEAVAEGVETAEQADRLHEIGYQFAQGFHFARPMPPEDVALLLDQAVAEVGL